MLVLSVALILAGSALPRVAQEAVAADAGGCSAHATSFATAPVEEGTAGLRVGCARDAGGLRSLASGDNDLVAALDFNPGARPDQLHQEMQELVDGIHADQSNGLSLSQSLTLNAEKNSVDPCGAPARLGSLIDQILRDDPHVTLLVSTIVPAAFPETAARIATYNAAIPGVVQARQAAGEHVRLVRMDAVTPADLADGLHPDNHGYQKTAEAFYDGMVTAAQAGGIAASGSGTSPVGGPVKGWFPQGTIASGTFGGGAGTAVYADINGDGKADYLQVNDDSSVQAWRP